MKTTTRSLLLTGLLTQPALAHPGHGFPGWLHHGELVVLASAALATVVVRRIRAVRARRRRGDR